MVLNGVENGTALKAVGGVRLPRLVLTNASNFLEVKMKLFCWKYSFICLLCAFLKVGNFLKLVC